MSLMLVMVTMRICTATSSVVNIAVLQSQHYLVFLVLLIFCFCFSNSVFTGFHQHLEVTKLKNLIPRIHQNAPESIVYAEKILNLGIPKFGHS